MQLTRHELDGQAEFLGDASFRLAANPFPQQPASIPLGLYELPRRSGEAHLYRLNHPLAEILVANAKNRDLPTAEIQFDYGQHDGKITRLEPLIGKIGWLALSLFSVEALDQAEDHLILSAVADDGQTLEEDVAQRLLTLPCASAPRPLVAEDGIQATLDTLTQSRQANIQRGVSERNARFFEAEADKLDGWADDLKVGLEREIKEIDRQIKEARRAATTALTLDEKLAGQKQIKALEAQRNQKRRSLFDAQDQVDKQREELIAVIEGKLNQTTALQSLFMLRWTLL
jgi:adenine-specific DNA-methyltransferase